MKVINDGDLLVIMGLAIRLGYRSAGLEHLQSTLEEWQKAIDQYGPGVIDLNLDDAVLEPERERELRALLRTVLDEVSRYHEVIPESVLNEPVSMSCIIFYDYTVSFVEEAVKAIDALVSER